MACGHDSFTFIWLLLVGAYSTQSNADTVIFLQVTTRHNQIICHKNCKKVEIQKNQA